MRLKVFRYSSGNDKPRYDFFEMEPKPGMTVLSALFYIQDHIDGSLSFRYSCRGAVCGSCAVLINKVPGLACRTQAASLLEAKDDVVLNPYPAIVDGEEWKRGEEILVEPLPHFPVIKDLVVDMSSFFKYYHQMEPCLKSRKEAGERENMMTPSDVRELENYTNCVLCAACFGACPVDAKDPAYLGPAALAKLYRFRIDPRDALGLKRLKRADNPRGWWACEFHANCRKVCPKDVAPNVAIGRARAELEKKQKPAKEN